MREIEQVIEDSSGRALARYWPDWLAPSACEALWQALEALPWQRPEVQVFGRHHPIPRQQCYLGEPGCHYRYSGTLLEPEPLPPEVAALMANLNRFGGWGFNSVLVNRYRDGNDKMGWHRDNEPELGPSPQLAILSLGAARPLRLGWGREDVVAQPLGHGSLLALEPGVWHGLNPSRRVQEARVSLTFRAVIPGFHCRA
ncbi:alpha-ketoglutarate-dependent dioxygenase AlkB family protein [Ferrimonas gelatinilytica]